MYVMPLYFDIWLRVSGQPSIHDDSETTFVLQLPVCENLIW